MLCTLHVAITCHAVSLHQCCWRPVAALVLMWPRRPGKLTVVTCCFGCLCQVDQIVGVRARISRSQLDQSETVFAGAGFAIDLALHDVSCNEITNETLEA